MDWSKFTRTELEHRLEVAESALTIRLRDKSPELARWSYDPDILRSTRRYFRALEWCLMIVQYGIAPSKAEIERAALRLVENDPAALPPIDMRIAAAESTPGEPAGLA